MAEKKAAVNPVEEVLRGRRPSAERAALGGDYSGRGAGAAAGEADRRGHGNESG